MAVRVFSGRELAFYSLASFSGSSPVLPGLQLLVIVQQVLLSVSGRLST